MTSLHGFMDGSVDYKQTYQIKDTCGQLPLQTFTKNTVLYTLSTLPQYAAFFKLILRNPPVAATLNDPTVAFTIFVPANLPANTPDYEHTKWYIYFHMTERRLDYNFLTFSRAMVLTTKLPDEKILVENINQKVILNRNSTILSQQNVGNATIYFIDNAIQPLRL
jgi:uncharacterized surface protein with fasciclin (FAS1) repeats